jgi:hypothetical protein
MYQHYNQLSNNSTISDILTAFCYDVQDAIEDNLHTEIICHIYTSNFPQYSTYIISQYVEHMKHSENFPLI